MNVYTLLTAAVLRLPWLDMEQAIEMFVTNRAVEAQRQLWTGTARTTRARREG